MTVFTDWEETKVPSEGQKVATALALTYLGNHHMAIEGSSAFRSAGAVDMWSDFGHDWGAECHVGDKVTVHLE